MTHPVLITATLLLLTLYIAATALVALRQADYIYRPDHNIDTDPSDAGLTFEDITLKTPDGETLQAWFVPAHNASRTNPPVILFCHGNGGDLGNRVETLQVFHSMGFSTLAFDYRGYGKSSGTPSEQGTYTDAMTAWNHLTKERKIAPEAIIIYGRSLGGAVACQLATQVNPRGLAVESAFASINAMAKKMFPLLPVALFSKFSYDNVENIKKIKCPLLMSHSRTDRTCPYSQGKAVFQVANEPKQFIELTGNHNDLAFNTTPAYRAAFQTFCRR